MSQYRIINICQITNNVINCAQESVSLLTKGGAVKIKMQICFNIKVRGTKWIQSILKLMLELVLTQMIQTKLSTCEVFDSFAIVVIKSTVWRWSNKL